MMQLISIEFLVAFLFIVDLFLIFLIFLFVKQVNRLRKDLAGDDGLPADPKAAFSDAAASAGAHAAKEVSQMLEPLLEASKSTALEFDQLICEKKKISADLNHALDSKMISMNLILSRAGVLHKKMEEQLREIRQHRPGYLPALSQGKEPSVLDQQNQILDLYHQKNDIDTIAERLSIPKGEVQLVVDLKEKFVAMEHNS